MASSTVLPVPPTLSAGGAGRPTPTPPWQSPGQRISAFIDRHVLAVFATPAAAFIVLTMAFPVVFTIYLSLTHWVGGANRPPEFVGLDNFIRLFTDDPRFWGATFRTIALTTGAVLAQTVLGVAIAVLLHRKFVLSGLVRSVVLLPMIATPVAVALVWRLMFNPQLGVFNDILQRLGLPASDWLADPNLALWLIGLVDTWEWAPLIALITLAGLTALPEEPFEAASIDGANGWQRFWHVTLPMVRPIVVVAVVFRLIEALKTFDIILVMTNGGPGFVTETLNIYAYNIAFQYQQLGYAAALLIVFFLLVLLVSSSVLRLRRSKES
ncbi:sugar ABC transporter permease [Microbacterium sp. PRC9]|uniref:carbohydrate ABC transporter permease n=1 Tax=Microbacterium sp. PRC9 TaxID=2962591 RepID=UPI002880CCDD|nr:sugar ABC transporter permease [Microbacterium sp. PRC9]MDT0143162.1 sugar ABC transporter permease [Microbacterium sp. PRC9]